MEEHQTPPSILPLPLEELVPLLQAWLQARLPEGERKPGRPRTFSDLSLFLFHLVRWVEGPGEVSPGHLDMLALLWKAVGRVRGLKAVALQVEAWVMAWSVVAQLLGQAGLPITRVLRVVA
ncbi:hypothetical protein CSW47_14690 [Thermus scotoductus]|uniref:Uncharacterized protein n=1 Tax=Thermus scotoductus TaxID=37636 RepID=A0A430QXS2_THESC|nr:hypothetical protein [Thermus scotoductus]RTG99938.1 hypothetical protein CSW47_14690 [Thermus scotoductus]